MQILVERMADKSEVKEVIVLVFFHRSAQILDPVNLNGLSCARQVVEHA